jgi:hypothetical protein
MKQKNKTITAAPQYFEPLVNRLEQVVRTQLIRELDAFNKRVQDLAAQRITEIQDDIRFYQKTGHTSDFFDSIWSEIAFQHLFGASINTSPVPDQLNLSSSGHIKPSSNGIQYRTKPKSKPKPKANTGTGTDNPTRAETEPEPELKLNWIRTEPETGTETKTGTQTETETKEGG